MGLFHFLRGRIRTARQPRLARPALEPLEARTVLDAASDRAFADKAFQALLGRVPEPAALDAFAAVLTRLASTTTQSPDLLRSQFVLTLESSPEFRAREAQELFARYLNRPADPATLTFFVNALARGTRVEQLAATLAATDEYFITQGMGTNDGFLNALFLDALDRPIDPAAFAAFSQLLATGVTRAQLASFVTSSPEYAINLVQRFYVQFLGRPGDAASVQLFASALGNGATDEQVIAVLLSSPEFLPSAPEPVLQTLNADMRNEIQVLLDRASAATPSTDGIIAIVDRNGRILGVRVEDGVSPAITGNPEKLTFAIDGAVAEARTGAFFGNNAAPLTSRTIQFISQTTMTEREINSDPNVPDKNSPLRGPGFVAPIGIMGRFPPGVQFTPQVDLFAIEHTNRDSVINPGPNMIRENNADGSAGGDDIPLSGRFNINPAFVPPGKGLFAPESYGFVSGLFSQAQSRGIGTLPGGIPIVKNRVVVGGIGVFYPGTTGFASEENSSLSSNFDPTRPDRSSEAEFVAFAALGGSTGANFRVGDLGGIAPLAGFDLPFGRVDLVGITLPLFGPMGLQGPDMLRDVGRSLGLGAVNGVNQAVTRTGATNLDGLSVPDGFLVVPHAGTELSADDVTRIIQQGVFEASRTRAAIRLSPNSTLNNVQDATTRMVLAVTDRITGEVLGLFRMPDSTIFSIDVAVAKARNVAYYADATQLQPIDQIPDVPAGTAATNRTFRYVALPRFPEGIEGAPPGPYSILNDGGVNLATGLTVGPPLPAAAFLSVQGFDAFNPQTNFRQPVNPNQNGIVFFPGSAPLYKGRLVGGFGISGDGVDQDDVVTFAGSAGFGVPDQQLRADEVTVNGVRLPYQKFNRKPQAG